MSSIRVSWPNLIGIFATFLVIGPLAGFAVLAVGAGGVPAALIASIFVWPLAYVVGLPAAMLAGMVAIALAGRGPWWLYLIGCSLAGAVAAPLTVALVDHQHTTPVRTLLQFATTGGGAALACSLLTLGMTGTALDLQVPATIKRLRADQVLLITLAATMVWMVAFLLVPKLAQGL